MWRYAIVWAFFLAAACSSKSEPAPERTLVWQWPAGQSLAYRFVATATATTTTSEDGQDKGPKTEDARVEGHVFIDVDPDGQARLEIRSGSSSLRGQSVLGMSGLPALRPAASNFFFPLPETAIAGAPVEQTLVIEGLGITSTHVQPDIHVSETLRKVSDDGRLVQLSFSRTGRAVGDSSLEVTLQERGRGVFDLDAGRYERVEHEAEMSMSGTIGGESVDMSLAVVFSLSFDAARSQQRTQEMARLREPPVSAEELARFLRENPASMEIARAVRDVENGQAGALLLFHLRANPVALWREAMTLPDDAERAFVSALRIHMMHGRRPPEALIAWLRREVRERPLVADLVASMRDERLRAELEALASSPDADTETAWVARRARESLAVLDALRQGPASLARADAKRFMELGHALQAPGQDLRGLVPVLIDMLERTKDDPSRGLPIADVCVQWLEGLTSRSFGRDVDAWRSFWQANQDRSYCGWMIDAAAQDTPLLVHNALSRLSACADTPGAADRLARLLARHARPDERMADERARLIAARGLAEMGDARAIPVLIEMLAHENIALRSAALIALASYRDTTLGYQPDGDEAERGAALRRWRAWAQARSRASAPVE